MATPTPDDDDRDCVGFGDVGGDFGGGGGGDVGGDSGGGARGGGDARGGVYGDAGGGVYGGSDNDKDSFSRGPTAFAARLQKWSKRDPEVEYCAEVYAT